MPAIPLSHAWVGLLSYLTCHGLHIWWWRRFPERRGVTALFGIFLALPASLLAAARVDWLAPMLLHVLISANYIAIYPAVQATSPTLRLLLFLREPRRRGELDALFGANTLLEDRLTDLKASRLVRVKENRLVLTSGGSLLAGFFAVYRRALALPAGGG
jgi:hypothetical protein